METLGGAVTDARRGGRVGAARRGGVPETSHHILLDDAPGRREPPKGREGNGPRLLTRDLAAGRRQGGGRELGKGPS